MNDLAGIILSAGLSSRMGDFKPLISLDGRTMIGRVIDMMKNAGASPVVVVTGHRHEELEAALAAEGVETVFNPNYAHSHQFDSLLLALARPWPAQTRLMISPVDVPMVDDATVDRLLEADGDVVRPTYQGHPGHPILLSAKLIPYLQQYDGRDGLRGAIAQSHCRITDVPVKDRGISLDNDTPADLVRLAQWTEEKGKRGK